MRIRPSEAETNGHANSERLLESRPSVGDQVIAWIAMSRRRVSSGPSRGLGRRRGPPRDIDLRQAGEVGETLDRMPVAVPRPEVHLAEAASHPEDVIDDADALNERRPVEPRDESQDRKSTRLNSSHEWISYAVFCLKKKNHKHVQPHLPASYTLVDVGPHLR